jgi:hypothetical protein
LVNGSIALQWERNLRTSSVAERVAAKLVSTG